MKLYFAPLEGVTDAVFRRTHNACFGGIDKYFIPFISPTQNLTLTTRELAAVSPEANAGLFAVPQVLTKHADHFLWAARTLYAMGYSEVNVNLGCPSGTVTAKGKGSGMLCDRTGLPWFLDEIFARTPMPISIKTRLGYSDPDEFFALMEVYSRYPVSELIVHARTRSAFYKGTPKRDVFLQATAHARMRIVYNGDLFTAGDCDAMRSARPDLHALMLGRGLIANPALARQASGGEGLTMPALRDFHDRLREANMAMHPQNVALGRMREIAKYMLCCFESPEKPMKAIRKAANMQAYDAAIRAMFDEHALAAQPKFLAP